MIRSSSIRSTRPSKAGRAIAALLVALIASVGAVTLSAPSASATTSYYYSVGCKDNGIWSGGVSPQVIVGLSTSVPVGTVLKATLYRWVFSYGAWHYYKVLPEDSDWAKLRSNPGWTPTWMERDTLATDALYLSIPSRGFYYFTWVDVWQNGVYVGNGFSQNNCYF